MSNEKISISRIGPFGLSYCTAGAGATAAGSIWGAIGASGAVTPGIAATVVGAAAGGFAGSFSGALMNGTSFGAAFKAGLKSAAISAATAYASHGIGGYFNKAKEARGIWANDYANWGGRTLAHATVGGVASEVQGGEFRHGFYSSAFSTGIMHGGVAEFMGGDAGGWYIAGRTAVAALIGGTAAELSGGKFSNGAWTSALQHLFNAEGDKIIKYLDAMAARDEKLSVAQGNPPSPKVYQGDTAERQSWKNMPEIAGNAKNVSLLGGKMTIADGLVIGGLKLGSDYVNQLPSIPDGWGRLSMTIPKDASIFKTGDIFIFGLSVDKINLTAQFLQVGWKNGVTVQPNINLKINNNWSTNFTGGIGQSNYFVPGKPYKNISDWKLTFKWKF